MHLNSISYQVGHATCQMIQVMTVVEPDAGIVGHKLNGTPAHASRDDQSVFFYPDAGAFSGALDFKKMAVQMHGMWHHAVVEVLKSDLVSGPDAHIIGIWVYFAVDSPVW